MLLTWELLAAACAMLILQYRPRASLNSRKRKTFQTDRVSRTNRAQQKLFRKSSRSIIRGFRMLDIGMLLTEVSTRLRSGAMIETAWAQTLAHYGLLEIRFGLPRIKAKFTRNLKTNFSSSEQRVKTIKSRAAPQRVLDEDGVPQVLRKIWQAGKLEKLRLGIPNHVTEAFPAAFAVCRLGYCAGAPMAEVLDACARGVTEASEARAARKTALAGPLASARMLAALPVLGIFFGIAMGVDVLDFLLQTFLGNICLILGLAFEAAGIIYVRLLVLQAMRDEH